MVRYLSIIFILTCASCGEEYTPRPQGFFRIDLPGKHYLRYTGSCPFSFDYPSYARVVPYAHSDTASCWMNIDFHSLLGTVHLSYYPVRDDLQRYTEDSRALAYKHTIRAEAIEESVISRQAESVYGIFYDISGAGAASPVQFYLTDSAWYFLRGALYFNLSPRNDSLAPVILFIKEDIRKFIETFQWKKKM